MDLYRTLRLAIYLVAATGGWAISQVEGQPSCFLAVVAAAGIAWITVDAGRMRPVRPALSAAFGIALLIHYLATPGAPALEGLSSDAGRMMHFLCALQIMLFFTTFRGSLIFTFCGANLFIVIVSGKVEGDVSLLLRLALFLGTTTWLLFIHALWLERQKFETRQSMPGPPGLTRVTSRDRISERAFWQGLRLTTYVTLTCLLAGFLLFFVWPRATFAAWTDWLPSPPSESDKPGKNPNGGNARGGTPTFSRTGPGDALDLSELGSISPDPTPALSITLDVEPSSAATFQDALYLRDRALSEFGANGQWKTPPVTGVLNSVTAYIELNPNDPKFLKPPESRDVRMTIHPTSLLAARACYVLAPPRQINLKPLEEDAEGALLLPNKKLLGMLPSLALTSNRPVRRSELPVDAKTVDPDRNRRYTNWRNAFAGTADEIEQLATVLTATATTDLEKIDLLLNHLRSGRYGYTLDLNKRKATPRNPLAEFLLSENTTQRQGHCGYFASAFVILARAAKLPARIATGFAHTLTPSEARRKNGEIRIRYSDAHAWAEVYFEKYGWVTVDPTSGVPTAPPEPKTATPLPDGRGTPQPGGQTLKPIDSGWLDRGWTFFKDYSREDQERLYGQFGDRLDRATEAASGMFSLGSDWGGLGVVFTWLLVAGAGVALVLFFWNRKEKRRAGPANLPRASRVAVTFYQELLHVLSRHGFLRRPGQTPREFAASVVRRGGDAFLPALVVTQVFERVRYGGEEPTSLELDDLRAAMDFLNRYGEPGQQ